ncbi:iron-sulfur cluster-binding protein [candidate division KSB1 bacterium]|nr:iron-sulfur cluster-binding protein [candidate division KSB1 bacterium]
MEVTPVNTKKYVRNALADVDMRKSVDKATQSTVDARQAIIDQTPYWEELRFKTHSIKKNVMDNLDTYLTEFEKHCQENGIQVHWASDAAEAREIILRLARENKVKKIVKSKSLTTEEMHLNQALIDNNIETLETDLGEYIIQLMEQIPSHLIIPALHLSRKDVGKLFHEKLGTEYTDEPTELLKIARAKLREKFLTADMGISGVNFGIAGAGAFCIVENEANAHLTMTLPKIHVAVMGIEKLIPKLSDLPYFLKLLAPNATGQKSSTYVNIIGGPLRDRFGEGSEEVHLVLMDNGRSRILRDPSLRETLFCIRCASCLNACPVYQQIGGHAYGWVYMGPIGITLIPQYLGEKVGSTSPYLSTLCSACFDACPMRIRLPDHILKLRNRIVENSNPPLTERIGMALWGFLAKHPRLYRVATWFPGKAQQLLPGDRTFPLPGYARKRAFARFDAKGFRNRFKDMENSDE